MTEPRITAELIDHYRRTASRLRAEAFRAAFVALWRSLARRRAQRPPQAAVAAWR